VVSGLRNRDETDNPHAISIEFCIRKHRCSRLAPRRRHRERAEAADAVLQRVITHKAVTWGGRKRDAGGGSNTKGTCRTAVTAEMEGDDEGSERRRGLQRRAYADAPGCARAGRARVSSRILRIRRRCGKGGRWQDPLAAAIGEACSSDSRVGMGESPLRSLEPDRVPNARLGATTANGAGRLAKFSLYVWLAAMVVYGIVEITLLQRTSIHCEFGQERRCGGGAAADVDVQCDRSSPWRGW